jgi:hypothetical protein
MSHPVPSSRPAIDRATTLDAEVDDAISLCGGDARAALRATLLANASWQHKLNA